MAKTSRLLFFILFGTMIIFGFIENIKGVTFPLIKTDFDASYEQQGLMVSLISFAYMLFCFIGGIILGKWGVKKAYTAGVVFMIAGLAAVFFTPNYWLSTAALFLVCSAFGLFEVSVNALATQLFTSRAALLMSLMHFFYGAGSSLSPRAAGAVAAALSWREVYLFSIPVALVVFIPSIFTRFPGAQSPDASGTAPADLKSRLGFFTALKIPMVWVFAVTLGFMVAVELCSANWAGLYFQDVYRLDPRTAGASFISNFYILFTVSRLVSGFAIEKIGYTRSLIIAALAVVFIFVLGFIFGEKGVYILPGLGFFTAIFWPTVMAAAMTYFKEDSPVITSAIIVIAGAMNSGIQFLMGLTNRFAGPAWGYRSGLIYAVLIVASLAVLLRCMRNPYKR
jgi:fucose permease